MYNYNFKYDQGTHVLTVTVESKNGDNVYGLNIIATGCVGQDGSLDRIKAASRERGLYFQADARGQVAKGMAKAAVQSDVPTLLFLLGDLIYPTGVDAENSQKAIQTIQNEVLTPYGGIDPNVPRFFVFGNHEAACEGKGPGSVEGALQKERAFIKALQEAQSNPADTGQFHMPDRYYALIIKNNVGNVLACIVCADTNLLPNDADQLAWLQTLPAQFSAAGATTETHMVWMGHHTLGETVSGRMFKYEGKKYANPDAGKANQHALILAALKEIAFPLQQFMVFASHIHDTTVRLFDSHSANNPIGEVAVSGGSWSNKGELKTLARGMRFADSTFSFSSFKIVLHPSVGSVIRPLDELNNIELAIYDCSGISLDNGLGSQTSICTFHAKGNYAEKTWEVLLNKGVHKKLLKTAKKDLDFFEQANKSSGTIYLKLACYLWTNYRKEIQQLQQKENANSIAQLLRAYLLPVATGIGTDSSLPVQLEASIAFLILPIVSSEAGNQYVGLKDYSQLYKTLQAFFFALSREQERVLDIFDGTERSSNIDALESYSNLVPDEDSDNESLSDEGELQGISGELVSDDRAQSEVDAVTEENPLDRVYTEAFSSEHAARAIMLKTLFMRFLEQPDELRKAVTLACRRRLEFLYNQRYENFYGKHLEHKYLNFIAYKHPNLARVLTVDFLSTKVQPVELIIAVQMFQIQANVDVRANLSGFILNYVATTFELWLKREQNAATNLSNDAVHVLQAWSESGSVHRATEEFVFDYFKAVMKDIKENVLADFLSRHSVRAIWAPGSIFEPGLQAFYDVEKYRETFECWEKQPSLYLYDPRTWLRAASSAVAHWSHGVDPEEAEEESLLNNGQEGQQSTHGWASYFSNFRGAQTETTVVNPMH